MGNYATTTSISVRLPGIMMGDTTTSDDKFEATFSNYIDQGEAEFNAVAAKRYSLPFTTPPPLARSISFDIAAFYTIRAFSTRDWPNENTMLEDFQKAFDKLEQIEKGEIKLTDTEGSLLTPISSYAQSNREGQGSVFEMDNPINWAVDKDRLDDLKGSRD